MSATYPPDYCGHCSLNVDWCFCWHCEHCARWTGLEDDDVPEFCRTCAPMFDTADTIPPPASHEVAKPARVVLRDVRAS
jgi:hypothetical protein